MSAWKPGASVRNLQLRAELLAKTRVFFAQRNVLEVETPLLGANAVTDVNIESFQLSDESLFPHFLQTSPEYAMKRLLAAGSGPVYQICKAFRQDECGRLHNPEFTLLEWYRPGFSWQDLMAEVGDYMAAVLAIESIPGFSYAEVFLKYLGINPHAIEEEELASFARQKIDISAVELDDTDYLQLLMHHCIEPELPEACFIYDYPVKQAALAQTATDEEGHTVARRFELYAGGMELANAYQELTDASEQRRRFEADSQKRRAQGLPDRDHDERLIAALEHGLPECSGVALGFDRLVMLAADSDDIREVIAFASDRA